MRVADVVKFKQKLKVLGVGCAHVPETDMPALNAVLKFADFYKPDVLVLGGDFIDMESVSHWEDNTDKLLKQEADAAKSVISDLMSACGRKCKERKYIIGNHEIWYDQYVNKEAKAFKGLLSIEELLGLNKSGFDVIPFNDLLQIGNAFYTHGLYTNKYHASKMLDSIGANVYYWHTHDTQSYQARTVKGIREAQACGCLRKLDAGYLKNRPSNWIHAFLTVDYFGDNYTPYVHKIINGKFSFNGKLFEG